MTPLLKQKIEVIGVQFTRDECVELCTILRAYISGRISSYDIPRILRQIESALEVPDRYAATQHANGANDVNQK